MSPNESLDNYRIGRLACEAGWMTVDKLGRCLQLQREREEQGGTLRFGEVAVAEGYLTNEQVQSLLKLQALQRPPEYDKTFGGLAVRQGFVTQDDIDLCLKEQQRALRLGRKAPTLGSMLVDRGLLTLEQLREVLRLQSARGDKAPPELERLVRNTGISQSDAGTEEPAPNEPEEPDTALTLVCKACGNEIEVPEWNAEFHCPNCGEKSLEESPKGKPIRSYDLADRRYGPAVEDGRLGRMAMVAGWLTKNQVDACLERQKWSARRNGRAEKFGEVAVDKRFLTHEQVEALLRIQTIHRPAEYDRTFGAVAVRLGLATRGDVDRCLRHQVRLLESNREAPMLGLLMIEMRVLTPAQVRRVVNEQAGKGPFAELQRFARKKSPRLLQKIKDGARRRFGSWTRGR